MSAEHAAANTNITDSGAKTNNAAALQLTPKIIKRIDEYHP
jgi:hypothetical protein